MDWNIVKDTIEATCYMHIIHHNLMCAVLSLTHSDPYLLKFQNVTPLCALWKQQCMSLSNGKDVFRGYILSIVLIVHFPHILSFVAGNISTSNKTIFLSS